MSAILSTDDLNDFISPGVECVKPVETLPVLPPVATGSDPNSFEVTTEGQQEPGAAETSPASISLADCLACSGCVTSAEAVLIKLQSHEEVSSALERHAGLEVGRDGQVLATIDIREIGNDGILFVASVSPQARASLATLYGTSSLQAGYMIEQFLAGEDGLKSRSARGNSFTWVIDTNRMREVCRLGVVAETLGREGIGDATEKPRRPILASACPGWICYAEKTHPYVLPYLSRLKSPQALSGTMVKSVLSKQLGIPPSRIWHLAIMPCFDKKLEASRQELTDAYWHSSAEASGARDVDCVITPRELLLLAESRGIDLRSMPGGPVSQSRFPDPVMNRFLFPPSRRGSRALEMTEGTSGGFAHELIKACQVAADGSEVVVSRGRNADIVEYSLVQDGKTILRTARFYGFRNIQNLVRKLKPAKTAQRFQRSVAIRDAKDSSKASLADYDYIEVMACPGGCTNGGGQIKAVDAPKLRELAEGSDTAQLAPPVEQKQWLSQTDEAYFLESVPESGVEANGTANHDSCEVGLDDDGDPVDAREVLNRWTGITGVPVDRLLYTSYRQVESDMGKLKGASDMERVARLASGVGGGW